MSRGLTLRLLVTGAAGVVFSMAILSSVVACNAVLGITDVQLKGRDSGKEKDAEPDPEPDPEPEEDAGVPSRPNVLQVALGEAHSCARTPQGSVRCWGDDVQGQIGAGALTPEKFVTSPRDVVGITDAVDIAAGRSHNCVARTNGRASCWGFNLDGQLGNGETGNRKPSPVEVSGLTSVVAVAAGSNFSCALRGGGTVACWGANGAGQLGKGDDAPSSTPVTVPGLGDVVAIAAGQAHACAVKKTGEVMCWGEGSSGQLGKAPAASSQAPVAVENIADAATVAAGESSTCAITKTGAVMCWGANDLGQLGNGTPSASPIPTPVPVTNLSDAVSVAVGRAHACAARKTGAVACWGAGARGQLGDGVTKTASEATATFVLVSNIQGAVVAGAGREHSCVSMNNQVQCWGANDRGQLGSANTDDAKEPVPVSGFP